jgi:hypothetical protein
MHAAVAATKSLMTAKGELPVFIGNLFTTALLYQ